MALLLIVGLYAVAMLFLAALASLEMSNEFRLAFNIVGGIGALILPIAAYSLVDFKLTKAVVKRIARGWCSQKDVEFVRAEVAKNHFSVVYRDGGNQQRQKFRICFVLFSWKVREVQWL